MKNEFNYLAKELAASIELFKAYVNQCRESKYYNEDILNHFSKSIDDKKEILVGILRTEMNNTEGE